MHWYGVVCWAFLRPILLSSVVPHKVHGAPAPSVQQHKVFSVYHLHAPPPDRNVPLQWLAPQFGMTPLCRSSHSLELFLSYSSVGARWSSGINAAKGRARTAVRVPYTTYMYQRTWTS